LIFLGIAYENANVNVVPKEKIPNIIYSTVTYIQKPGLNSFRCRYLIWLNRTRWWRQPNNIQICSNFHNGY